MLSPAAYPSVFLPKPPPLWYVSRGDVTVGPVITTQLTRGVASGRVPDDCLVRAWRGDWRDLASVREVAALHKPPTKDPKLEQIFEWELAADRVKKDAMELCHTVAWLARMATGAECAIVHFRSRLDHPLRTRAVVGPMPTTLLGHPLPESDPALHEAFRGRAIVGPPFGRAEDALAIRFASSKNGVVGSKGRNIPRTPKPTEIEPKMINRYFFKLLQKQNVVTKNQEKKMRQLTIIVLWQAACE